MELRYWYYGVYLVHKKDILIVQDVQITKDVGRDLLLFVCMYHRPRKG